MEILTPEIELEIACRDYEPERRKPVAALSDWKAETAPFGAGKRQQSRGSFTPLPRNSLLIHRCGESYCGKMNMKERPAVTT
ncbi:hypothetical protein NDU88_002988 [Pleurodeles waltl]|uniref:Uncharacterized protein n=1 Tax=Pleurodeles waltl TaxID=8319 RepID=A0AAV7SEY4_PLEWA|nr:hypothetical protein NDU88_002988 [Pleurodeles waltl]